MNLFLLPSQLIHQVLAESIFNFLKYRARYHFSPISQWWRNTWRIYGSGSGFGCSPKFNQFGLATHPTGTHQVYSESIHNFLRCRAIYRFRPSLSMVKNHLKNSHIWIWIRIFIKIKCCCPCLVNYKHKKFQNDCLNCGQKSCDRDRQTGKCYRPTKLPKKYFWPRNKQKDRGENITSSHLRWWR